MAAILLGKAGNMRLNCFAPLFDKFVFLVYACWLGPDWDSDKTAGLLPQDGIPPVRLGLGAACCCKMYYEFFFLPQMIEAYARTHLAVHAVCVVCIVSAHGTRCDISTMLHIT